MTPARLALLLACTAACVPDAHACNPDPPRPPILQGFAYDAMAAEFLLREATSVVAARLELKLELDDPSAGRVGSDYVFAVLEGWRAETPRKLTVGGHWVDCAIEPRAGRVFLLYLDGERLLHAVPVATLDFEIELLGEPDWFYDVRGRLVRGPED